MKRTSICLLAAAVAVLSGCWSPPENQVVVYAALDREFSEPILQQFTEDTGVAVAGKYDVESTKTVGLTQLIIEERRQPRCDVFWNNEILHTLRLQEHGLLDVYQLPQADKFPPAYRCPDGRWYGFAARARVLIINTELLEGGERPQSIHDLADPRWKGQAAIARPLFGTTATHAAVLFATWGSDEARDYFRRVEENCAVLTGNKQVALAVARGQFAFGWTDTDDAIIEIERGMPVEIVYPDQEDGQLGALRIPNTLCIVRGGPNPEQARRLLDYLLTPDVERRLAEGPAAQFPMHADSQHQPRVLTTPVRWMDVDFQAAAGAWDEVVEALAEMGQ